MHKHRTQQLAVPDTENTRSIASTVIAALIVLACFITSLICHLVVDASPITSICPYTIVHSDHRREIVFQYSESSTRLTFYPLCASTLLIIWFSYTFYKSTRQQQPPATSTPGIFSAKAFVVAILIVPILYQGGIQCHSTLFLNYILCVAVDLIWNVFAFNRSAFHRLKAYTIVAIFTIIKIVFVSIEVTRMSSTPIVVWAYLGVDALLSIAYMVGQIALGCTKDPNLNMTTVFSDVTVVSDIIWFTILCVIALSAASHPIVQYIPPVLYTNFTLSD